MCLGQCYPSWFKLIDLPKKEAPPPQRKSRVFGAGGTNDLSLGIIKKGRPLSPRCKEPPETQPPTLMSGKSSPVGGWVCVCWSWYPRKGRLSRDTSTTHFAGPLCVETHALIKGPNKTASKSTAERVPRLKTATAWGILPVAFAAVCAQARAVDG